MNSRCSSWAVLLLAATAASSASPPARAQGGFPPPPVPQGNATTPAKVNLGKALFWEEQLSGTNTVACGTCHMFSSGGGDPRTATARHPGFDGRFGSPDDVHGSPGVVASDAFGNHVSQEPFPLRVQVTNRKALPVVMAAYNAVQFWDGRAGSTFVDPLTGVTLLAGNASLESQAVEPPLSTVEMAHAGTDWSALATKIASVEPLALATDVPPALSSWLGNRSYPELFREAFGSPGVTPARIAMAIATYQRTLVSNQAPLDQFRRGDPAALTAEEQRGLQIFGGPAARCATCHPEPLFTRAGFEDLGVRPLFEDRGRGTVTGNPADDGHFRIPTLRNVGLRAPYFHHGGLGTLEEVVDFYARGGDFRRNTNDIRPFPLGPADRAALVAFLRRGLTDPRVAAEQAPFDRPTLFSETARVPRAYGNASPGSGGFAPRLVGLEPAFLGNPGFTLAVGEALGGAFAVLWMDVQPAPAGTRILGVDVHLAGTPLLAALELGPLAGQGPGRGWGSLSLPIPADPELAGLALFLQAGVLDPGAGQGLAATGGLELALFAGR